MSWCSTVRAMAVMICFAGVCGLRLPTYPRVTVARDIAKAPLKRLLGGLVASSFLCLPLDHAALAADDVLSLRTQSSIVSTKTIPSTSPASPIATETLPPEDHKIPIDSIRLPYFHENIPMSTFLGSKATIIFNMKIDDPQTVTQFPDLVEMYNLYKNSGLNVLAFPSEQGWFEPDDDETCRLKGFEYFKFGDYPHAVVFDKVDFLGPSAHPLFKALEELPTPNGYGRITLNYEKFLLDDEGRVLRRYPRKFSAYDFEDDIKAVLAGQPLPPESAKFQKAWREAKREVVKSEYAFRYNYNYYTAPESMYKYNPLNDQVKM